MIQFSQFENLGKRIFPANDDAPLRLSALARFFSRQGAKTQRWNFCILLKPGMKF